MKPHCFLLLVAAIAASPQPPPLRSPLDVLDIGGASWSADDLNGELTRARGLHQSGDYGAATASYATVIAATEPGDQGLGSEKLIIRARALANYAALHQAWGNTTHAGQHYERAIASLDALGENAMGSTVRINYANMLMETDGNLAKAEAHLRVALDQSPSDTTRARRMLALLWAKQGKVSDGLALLPSDVMLRNEMGVMLERDERLEEAAGVFEEALRLDPTLKVALRGYGSVLHKLGRYVDAWSVMQRRVRAAHFAARTRAANGHKLKPPASTKPLPRPPGALVVVLFCHEYGNTWWPSWGPSSAGTSGLGGSEEAVVFIAEALASQSTLGRKQNQEVWVEVYGSPPPADVGVQALYPNVAWYPHFFYDIDDPPDVFIAWRYMRSLALVTCAAGSTSSCSTSSNKNSSNSSNSSNSMNRTTLTYVWLHDLVHPEDEQEFSEVSLQAKHVTGILCPSHFHVGTLPSSYARSIAHVTPNGLSPVFLREADAVHRGNEDRATGALAGSTSILVNDDSRFVYVSAPNRGLEDVLEMWALIREGVNIGQLRKAARLDVYYGFTDAFLKWGRRNRGAEFERWLAHMHGLLKQDGVHYHGLVNHSALALGLSRAGFLLYPTSFPETSCISLMKAQAHGAIPVTSRFVRSALNETCGKYDLGPPAPTALSPTAPASAKERVRRAHLHAWADAVVSASRRDVDAEKRTGVPTRSIASHRAEMATMARATFQWSKTAAIWMGLFESARVKKDLQQECKPMVQLMKINKTESEKKTECEVNTGGQRGSTDLPLRSPLDALDTGGASWSADDLNAVLDQARGLHGSGDYGAATTSYTTVLTATEPGDQSLGSEKLIIRARAMANLAALHQAWGNSTSAGQYYERAITSLDALEENAMGSTVRINYANMLMETDGNNNNLAKAEAHLRAALAGSSDTTRAQRMLALLLVKQGNVSDALALLPKDSQFRNEVGAMFAKDSRLEEAADMFSRAAVRLDPSFVSAWYNLGLQMMELGSDEGAAEAHGRVLQEVALSSGRVHQHSYEELVFARQLCGIWQWRDDDNARMAEFLDDLLKSIQRERDYQRTSEGGWGRGSASWGSSSDHRGSDSEKGVVGARQWALLRRRLTVQPFHAAAYGWMGRERLTTVASIHAAAAAAVAARDKQRDAKKKKKKKKKNHNKEEDERKLRRAMMGRDGRRLRVGYVSSDFRKHAVGLMVQSMFGLHRRVEVFAYSLSPSDGSDRRLRIEREAEHFVDLTDPRQLNAGGNLQDAESFAASATVIARRIEMDGIDILIDLNGHSAGARMDVFACHPAPLQVLHAATFSVPSGAPFYDYIIVDPHITNGNEHDRDKPSTWSPLVAPEARLVLPETFYVTSHTAIYGNDFDCPAASSKRSLGAQLRQVATEEIRKQRTQLKSTTTTVAAVAAATRAPTDFVFASFSQLYKIDPAMFDVWMGLLRSIPKSILVLVAPKNDNAALRALRQRTKWSELEATESRGDDETNNAGEDEGGAPEQESPVIARLRAEAFTRGVHSHRIVFVPVLPHEQHLQRACGIDLVLDTPNAYNGIMSTADALFAGVPVLTGDWGETMTSRAASSLVRNSGSIDTRSREQSVDGSGRSRVGGLNDCHVAPSAKQYEDYARKLARKITTARTKGVSKLNNPGNSGDRGGSGGDDDDNDDTILARQRLEHTRSRSALFDTERYVEHLEDGFESIAERYRRGLPPADTFVSKRP